MYRGHFPSSDTLHQLAQRSQLNPDHADVLTAADRQATVEQQLIEQLTEDDCRAQLQRIKLKRSTTNIHAARQDEQRGGEEEQKEQQQPAPDEPTVSAASSAAEPVLPAPLPAVVLSRDSSSPQKLQQRSSSSRRSRQPVVDPQRLDRKSTMHLQLEAILDRQIAALLDPNDPTVTRADMAGWPEEKIDQLVLLLKPQHLPELIRQSMLINELQPAKLLTWRDLTYVNQRSEPLVKNATGALAPGQLIGIFSGPDGGATPLLNVLGRRAVTGEVSGELLYDGREPDETFNKTVGYVLKDDPHLATLTVYETVFFSARLRLPTSTPDSLVRFRVLMIMKLLGLSHVGNNIVGNAAVRGISGGEKRRVSFAVEMVVGHSVLLADLPTNGLDSATAFGLMRTMRFACRASTSMLCSIVQPSPELFRLFHRIVVMSKGATLYFGPPDYAEGFFASLGLIRPEAKTVPQFLEELSAAPEKFYQPQLRRAPSEAVMLRGAGDKQAADADRLSEWEEKHVGTTHRKSRGILRPLPAVSGNAARLSCWNAIVDEYEVSEFKELLETQTLQEQQRSREEEMNLAKARAAQSSEAVVTLPATGIMRYWYRRYNSSPYQQLQQNLHRLTILFYRDKGLWRDTWIVNVCMSLFLGSLFYDLSTTETDVENRVGLLFFLCAYIGFGGLSLAPVVSFHRPTYYAQLNAAYFHAFAYFFSFVFLLTPIVIVEVFLLLLPAYGLAQLTGGVFRAEFGFALVLLCVVALASRSWVLIVLSLSRNEVLGNVALVMSNILFFLLAGFLIVGDEIEAAYYWLHIIDYFSYAFRALAINDILPRYNDCVLNTPGCTFNTGAQALQQIYGLTDGSKKWLDFARLCGVWAAFTIAAAFAYLLLNWDVPDEPEGPNWGHGEKAELTTAASHPEAAQAQDSPQVPSYAPAVRGGEPPPADIEMAKTEQPSQATAADGIVAAKSPSHAIAVPQALHLKKAYIQWSELCYDVVLPDGSTRRLLNNCYGYAAPGQMCALMGASGAGKSTLLDVLAGIKNQGTTAGELLVNGRPRDAGFTDIVGYVQQFDCFPDHDHQVLTEFGFLLLDELIAAMATSDDGRVGIACDVDGRLEYHRVQHSDVVIKPGRGQQFVLMEPQGRGSNGVSLMPTAGHAMWGQLGATVTSARRGRGGRLRGRSGPLPATHLAGEVLAAGAEDETAVFRVIGQFEHGVTPVRSSAALDFRQLQLRTPAQFQAFLRLFGYWLKHGGLVKRWIVVNCTAGEDASRTDLRKAWVKAQLEALPLATSDWFTCRTPELGWQFYITSAAWCCFFFAEYGAKYNRPERERECSSTSSQGQATRSASPLSATSWSSSASPSPPPSSLPSMPPLSLALDLTDDDDDAEPAPAKRPRTGVNLLPFRAVEEAAQRLPQRHRQYGVLQQSARRVVAPGIYEQLRAGDVITVLHVLPNPVSLVFGQRGDGRYPAVAFRVLEDAFKYNDTTDGHVVMAASPVVTHWQACPPVVKDGGYEEVVKASVLAALTCGASVIVAYGAQVKALFKERLRALLPSNMAVEREEEEAFGLSYARIKYGDHAAVYVVDSHQPSAPYAFRKHVAAAVALAQALATDVDLGEASRAHVRTSVQRVRYHFDEEAPVESSVKVRGEEKALSHDKWLPHWVFSALSKQELRLIVDGMQVGVARGASRGGGWLTATGPSWKEDLVHLLLLAGYSVHAVVKAEAGTRASAPLAGAKEFVRTSDVYTITYSTIPKVAHPKLRCHEDVKDPDDGRTFAPPDRVWCVTVPTRQHRIMFRRVLSWTEDGTVRTASRPIIVGNCHNPMSTIFEAVEFSGRLRLPRTVPAEDVKAKVWNVLRLLEIDHLSSAIIGAPSTGGVAPEIRKKVTIAVELIMEPSILFLDEPTTGLDSAAAYAVISTVSKLSEHMAVVCTIHQPPVEIVNFFREIILLKAGGEVVYFGPMKQLTAYFAEQGLGQVEPDKNPVDFALEQLKQANELAAAHKTAKTQDNSAVQPAEPDEQHLQDAEDEEKAQSATQRQAGFTSSASFSKSSRALTLSPAAAARLPELFLSSPYSQTVKETLKRGICPPEEVKSDSVAQSELRSAERSRASFSTQVQQLTQRNFLNVARNTFGLKVRFGTTILFSFFVGTIFLRLGYNQSWGQERLSVIFIAVANTLYGATAFLPEVYYTRTIYFREHTAGRMYTSGAYFIARYLGDAPFVIAEIFITSVMIYFMTGLNGNDHSRNFGFFFWTLLIVRWMSIAMTHFFATVIASPGFCATLLIAYMNTMFAACGFFIPQPSIQHDWLWYYDLVPIRYALDFLVQREFVADGNNFYCSTDQLIYVEPTYDTCPGAFPDPAGSGYLLKCPIQCGDDFLVKFGVSSSTIWQVRNMAILHCWMVFFFIMAYLALRFINHIKR